MIFSAEKLGVFLQELEGEPPEASAFHNSLCLHLSPHRLMEKSLQQTANQMMDLDKENHTTNAFSQDEIRAMNPTPDSVRFSLVGSRNDSDTCLYHVSIR